MNHCVRLSLLLALATLAAQAVDWNIFKPKGSISDFAGVADPGTRQQIESYCQSVERATGTRIALVTIPSLQGEPLDEVASAIFQAWDPGENPNEQRVLLLLAIGEQRSALEIGRGLDPILPGGLHNRILEEMRPALRRGRYAEAMIAAASTLGDSIARAKRVKLNASLPRRIHPAFWDAVPWAIFPGALILLIWLLLSGGTHGYGGSAGGSFWARHPGFLRGLSSSNHRAGWGGRGSGGFSGYDSGDSFGGFGGGAGVHPTSYRQPSGVAGRASRGGRVPPAYDIGTHGA
ncbi:MAG TPA: TPM domain-containing protein [Bryobacteraceae bacterium]